MSGKKRAILVVAILAVLVAVITFFQKQDSSLPARALWSAQKGGQWLLNYEGKLKDPGVLWVVKTVNEKYCQMPKLDQFVSEKFSEFTEQTPERWYGKLFGKIPNDKPNQQLLNLYQKSYDDIMLPAIYCDMQPISEPIRQKISNIASSSGYDLTHNFLALLFMKQNNCLQPNEESLLTKAAGKIQSELQNRPFNDLFAERVAFLAYSGYGAVQENWVQSIINSQLKDGGWFDQNFNPFASNPHTTALSFLALSEYLKTCPFGF